MGMTVHNSGDALAAEMMAVGAAARDAARAMREAGGDAKTRALIVAAAAIRSRAAEILAANKGDIDAAQWTGHCACRYAHRRDRHHL
jgi:glutamate-5-semialdehyde dehydrogenase